MTIQELIEAAKKNNSKKLDFNSSNERIYSIPKEVYQLENLEELQLGVNKIRSIPQKIKKLKKLREIWFFNTSFTKFPTALSEIESLKKVYIGTSKLIELPNELKNWKSLEYLYIGSSPQLKEINGIPPNLNYLAFSDLAITRVPEHVFALNSLTKLVLADLNLGSLPNELFSMKNLFSLFVPGNKLTAVPKQFARLENLRELWLYNNDLQEFPEIFDQQKITRINVSRNKIKTIPPNIRSLSSLEYLDISDNHLTELPQELFKLGKLNTLYLQNTFLKRAELRNKLSIIPAAILELQNLKDFKIDNDNIENIPSEIVKSGLESIRNFFQSKSEALNEDFLYEAKMVIVGRGNVGKTVLTKRLTNPAYKLEKSISTKGISILKNPFILSTPNLDAKKNFKLNIWDFGGQEKYDATHQLFITNRSIYLFLTEAREESNYLDFHYWLNTIQLFSNNSPVIVILSKCDERKKLLPETDYKDKFKNIIHFIDVSCADGYEYTIEALRQHIREAVSMLPQTKQKLSNYWIDVRNELENLSLLQDYISYEEYIAVCKQHSLDKTRADFLSQFLNDLGVIVHHQNDLLLKKTVFLNTDWCVDGIYKVLDDEKIYNSHGRFYY